MKPLCALGVVTLVFYLHSCATRDNPTDPKSSVFKNNKAPSVSITASATSGNVPLTIDFNATAIDSDGAIVSFYWDFGDGDTSAAAAPRHTFLTASTYTVVITVTDDNGAITQDSLGIVVGSSIYPTGVTINYRSVGVGTWEVQSTVSIDSGSNLLIFSPPLDSLGNLGQGDQLVLDSGIVQTETLFVLAIDKVSQAVLQQSAVRTHQGVGCSLTRAFNKLSIWEASRQGDLVTANRIEIAVCYNDGVMDDQVTIDGSTTNATHYLQVTVALGNRHLGIPGSGFQIILPNGGGNVVQINNDHTIISWLEITNWDGNQGSAIFSDQAKSAVISHNLIHDPAPPNSARSAISVQNNANSCLLYNNIIFSSTGANINTGIDGFWKATHQIYNNTIYNMKNFGINARDFIKFEVKNNLVFNSGQEDYHVHTSGANDAGTFSPLSTYNVSSDSSAPGTHSFLQVGSDSIFLSIPQRDFHLKANALAINAGEDLAQFFTNDIDGQDRDSTWDIGADEF